MRSGFTHGVESGSNQASRSFHGPGLPSCRDGWPRLIGDASATEVRGTRRRLIVASEECPPHMAPCRRAERGLGYCRRVRKGPPDHQGTTGQNLVLVHRGARLVFIRHSQGFSVFTAIDVRDRLRQQNDVNAHSSTVWRASRFRLPSGGGHLSRRSVSTDSAVAPRAVDQGGLPPSRNAPARRPGDWCGDRVGDAAGADAACGVPARESGTRVIGAVQEGADGIARTTFAAWAAGDPAVGAYGSVL